VIDSQRNKNAEKVRGASIDPSGIDAVKRTTGKKWQILFDTVVLLRHALVHPADIRDREGGVHVLKILFC
jgi:hypothetical protein